MKNEKGFTLIELIAVLVIVAIIALIVTPLVMTIIRKAHLSADKRSIDAYGSSTDYETSTVKQAVDAWKNTAVVSGDTAIARLITLEELTMNLECTSSSYSSWLYGGSYVYWTMSHADGYLSLLRLSFYGNIYANANEFYSVIRLVLELSKTVDISIIN